MNRRSFFSSLAIGLASAPALVKVVAEGPLFTYRKVNEWRPAPPGWRINPAWENAEYRVDFAMSPSMLNKFRGIKFGLDQRPLRFNA